MSNLPSVNSADLYSAIKAASVKIENYQETLNHISADIKALETHLKQRGINFPFSYVISDDLNETTTYEGPKVQSRQIRHQVLLTWDEEKDSGYRLRYLETKQSSESQEKSVSELASIQGGKIEVLEYRPLIECKAQTRIKSYEHLPRFVADLSNSIPEPTDGQGLYDSKSETAEEKTTV